MGTKQHWYWTHTQQDEEWNCSVLYMYEVGQMCAVLYVLSNFNPVRTVFENKVLPQSKLISSTIILSLKTNTIKKLKVNETNIRWGLSNWKLFNCQFQNKNIVLTNVFQTSFSGTGIWASWLSHQRLTVKYNLLWY